YMTLGGIKLMVATTNTLSLSKNKILAALPADEYTHLLPYLEEVEISRGEILSRPDEQIRYVYFPHDGSLSVVSMMENGSGIEVGVIGNEGMSGLPLVLGTNSAPLQVIAQAAVSAARIRAGAFGDEINKCGEFYRLLLRYGQAFFIQTAQNAACNRLHKLDERLARWLLMCRDRAKSDTLELTHEFLAVMLGVRRAGVSVTANKLQADGLISYNRGHINIIDRQRLEAATCECYAVVKKEFARLLHNYTLSVG
ncbi:MAG TPA: Crp/Fnr family transcriptional regulator, partial [Pyrinomonadaceae bacterium]|nr:Crp/Fnr family transcriptional regulator [Pyrinomonadaceae bacterium]